MEMTAPDGSIGMLSTAAQLSNLSLCSQSPTRKMRKMAAGWKTPVDPSEHSKPSANISLPHCLQNALEILLRYSTNPELHILLYKETLRVHPKAVLYKETITYLMNSHAEIISLIRA